MVDKITICISPYVEEEWAGWEEGDLENDLYSCCDYFWDNEENEC